MHCFLYTYRMFIYTGFNISAGYMKKYQIDFHLIGPIAPINFSLNPLVLSRVLDSTVVY